MYEYKMPSLGADMEAGTLVEKLKTPGESIARGDIIAVVETEKGAIEVEVFETGFLDSWLVEEGATVPVGSPLALIANDKNEVQGDVTTGEPLTHTQIEHPQPSAPTFAPTPKPLETAHAETTRIKASPAARSYARSKGIDLAGVVPRAPGAAILRADVEREPVTAQDSKGLRKVKPGLDLDKMRHAIAAAMARSKHEIPHYYLGAQFNLRRATQWLADLNACRQPKTRLLMNVLLMKAVADALTEYRSFNGFFANGTFMPSDGVHIGMAIALRGGGLMAPAIHDCDRKSLDEIMSGLRDLVARARTGSIRSSEISDPTITITSLGERGVDSIYGVIYPPQVAILGFGSPRLLPYARSDGALAAEPVIAASLAADHRVTDGHIGARFLSDIDARLQEPEKL